MNLLDELLSPSAANAPPPRISALRWSWWKSPCAHYPPASMIRSPRSTASISLLPACRCWPGANCRQRLLRCAGHAAHQQAEAWIQPCAGCGFWSDPRSRPPRPAVSTHLIISLLKLHALPLPDDYRQAVLINCAYCKACTAQRSSTDYNPNRTVSVATDS